MDESMQAVCGLDCEGCELRKAVFDDAAAQSVLDWFIEEGWLTEGATIVELRSRGPFCQGCRGNRSVHWSSDCTILLCCLDEKKLNNCSLCMDFPCEKLIAWTENDQHHAQALERLKAKRLSGG